VTTLEFLSTAAAPTAEYQPLLRSPLERALRPVPRGIRLHDLSLTLAKLEVHGDLDALTRVDLIRITPRRGLVLAPAAKAKSLEAKLRKQMATVVDRTGALAGLRVEGAHAAPLLRRLTDLDLERLPAAGAVGRVPALVRGGGEAFELFWPQEYGHYLAQVVLDTAEGLA
jgi:sarcosine oxidase gamma subunit